MNPNVPLLPGVVFTGDVPIENPTILVVAFEKTGKSSLTCSLFDYPTPGAQPLVLAFDETGPESCNKLGYRVPHYRICDQPGLSFFDKTKYVLTIIENAVASRQFPFSSIVVDCASTMTQRFFEEAEKTSKNPDSRAHYGDALRQSNHVLSRVRDLGLPNIWLAWLEPPHVQETKDERTGAKTKRFLLGRALIPGNFKANLAGRAQMVLFLEKVKGSLGQPGVDDTGYYRQIHTRTYDNIEAGGRFNDVLPEPCPPHLGYIINQIRTAPMIRAQARQQFQQHQQTNGAPTLGQQRLETVANVLAVQQS